MEEKIEEGLIKGEIDSIPIEKIEKILEQMKKCICKIITGKKNGTGFFCKIFYRNKLTPVLMTNYHLIDDHYIEHEEQINIYLNGHLKIIKINKESRLYSSKENKFDLMIIKLKEDEVNNYLEIDEDIFIDNSEKFYENNSIYILHYPKGNNVSVSFGYGIQKENDYDIRHLCSTDFCSSGSPILSLSSHKIIGIHKGCIKKKGNNAFNIGSYLKDSLNQLNNNKSVLDDTFRIKTNIRNIIDINESKSEININIHNLILYIGKICLSLLKYSFFNFYNFFASVR